MSDVNNNEATSDAELDRIIAQYLAQVDSGELVDQESFIAEHSQYAAELGEYFRDVAVVEQLANPDQGWGTNTIVDNSHTNLPGGADTDPQTIMRGAADSQTSIRPDGTQPQSASTIEGDFGRYKILKTLGQGGMGAVYLAHDSQLDRQVALKIPKFEDDLVGEMLERFYREARAAAMLRSPNICPVYDVGEIDGQHYITMAYIEGRPLKDFTTSKKRHSDRQIAHTIRKLASGLSEAHAAGVIHRDLKPANIMIDQKNEPVVMDFGLARRNAAAEVEVTRSGAILGTPAYMSPEQVEGDPADIGPQADVYGLGVIMYQLLTGTLPFQGTLMGILRQIALDEPKPPSELRKGLDSTIEGICLKMMAKDRAERYQSMDDVARDLSKYLKNPPKSKTTSSKTETTDDSSRIGEESNPVLRTVPPQVKAVTDFPQIKPIPKQSTSEKNPKRSAGEQRSALNRKIVIAVAAIAVLGLLYGAITLFLRVGEVDVKVVIDDPSISVHFEEGGVVKFEGSGKPIRLSPGKQKFVIERDGFKAETDEFQVKKDGKNILHVSLVNGKVVVLRNGERPAAIAKGDTRATGTSKSSPSASTGRFGLDFDGCVDKWGVTAELNVTADVSTIEAWITPTRSSTAAELPPTIRMAALFDRIEALADYRNSKQRLNLGITPRDSNNTSSGTFWDLYRTHKNITAPLNMGERVHVAGVVTQSSQNLYVNGRKVASELYTSEPHTYKALGLGTLLIRQWGYSGTMDEFRFSKGARYTGDFQPPQRFEADKQTVVLYHFDEGQGKFLKDSSGNGYHGTIKAAKWVRLDDSAAGDAPVSPDRERKAAEWVFSLDRDQRVTTNLGTFTSLERLPKEDFFITEIYLANHKDHISDEGFSQLNGLSRIESLKIHNTWAGDAACQQIAKLTTLKVLRLNQSNISDEGLVHLKRLPHLKEFAVFFSMQNVTDAGLRHLAGMTDLEALGLAGGDFSDKGLAHLDGLQHLKSLGLRETRVTDDGLAHLKGLKKLTYIDLRDTQVTAAGVADLKQALPNCNILYGPTTSAPLPAKAPFNEAQAKAHQQAWADYLGLPVEKEVVLPGGEKMAFVLVPPGEFMMGSSDEDIKRWQAQEDPNSAFWQGHLKAEGPQHRVRITQPFYLGKYEVTRAQWDSVSSGQPSKSTDQTCGASWDDTQPFLQKLNEGVGTPETRFALPTEAQWEFACRAGTTTAWYSGNDTVDLQRYAWISANAGRGSKPIGQRLPNAFGLYDMHGNVPEWCADWYSPDYYAESPTEDPAGPSSGTLRVTRGGGSISAATRTRSARRHPIEPSRQNNHPGFRVAISIDTAKLEAMPLPSADPAQERKAAEWVLSLDERRGSRRVSTNLGEFTAPEQLPKEDFVITQIDLRNQPHHISDEGFAQLNGLSHIERLHIHATNVGDVACQHIAKLTPLNYLAFVQTNVSDEGLVHLKQMPHLEHLSLSYGKKKITNAGLQHLASMTDLLSLDVSGTDANDAGLAHLVGLPDLERLGLNKTSVSDDGLRQLEKLVRLDSLELRETRVTDGGLAHLKGLKKLTYIDLRDTQVTAAGVADLKKALTNCRIEHGPIASAPRPTKAPFNEAEAKAHQKAWANHLGLPLEKGVALPSGQKMTFTLIPPGEFLIGSTKEQLAELLNAAEIFQVVKDRIQADESPARKVIITKPYYLGATEVTVGQFKEFATSSGYKTLAEKDPKTATDKTYLNPQFSTTDDLPVSFMSWKDADAFCRWLSEKHDKNYRLPTEAEWEYACRAGTTTHFSFGDDVKQMNAFAWNFKNSGRKPHPVGKKSPNAFGLSDMHGNMHEWCGDWYEEGWFKKSPPEDPIGPSTGSNRVLRGCTWGNEGFLLRSAFRDFGPQHDRNGGTGFRVAMTIDMAKLKTSQGPLADPNRAVAEWVIGMGGTITTNKQVISEIAKLPARPFVINAINLNFKPKVTNGDLKRLQGLTNLGHLLVHGAQISGAGLEHLKGLKNLRRLNLNGTQIGDADLGHLKGLPKLDGIGLVDTGVTARGVADLQKALPTCKIQWDGNSGPERAPAERVIHIGGMIRTDVDREKEIRAVAELPTASFRITSINLASIKGVADDDLARFQRLAKLTELHLSNTGVTDTGLRFLRGLAQLKLLTLEQTNVSDEGLQQLTDLASLARLDLGDTKISSAGLRHVSALPSLSELILSNTEVDDDGLKLIRKMETLRLLGLAGTKITDAGLAHLTGLSNLSTLDVEQTRITNNGLSHLKGLKTISRLELSETQIDDAGLVQLQQLPNLSHLVLGNLNISDKGLNALKNLKALTSLDLNDTKVTADGIAELKKALPQCEIEWDENIVRNRRIGEWVLLLEGKITTQDGTITSVAKLPEQPFQISEIYLTAHKNLKSRDLEQLSNLVTLTSLHLEDTGFKGNDFSHLRGLQQLEHLTIQGPRERVTAAGLEHLTALKGLKELHLMFVPVTDADVVPLKKMTNLQILRLSEAKISDRGLVQVRDLPNLTQLGLYGTNISDEGLKTIGKMKKLRVLHLQKTKVTDAGLIHLKGLKGLQNLWLTSTAVTPEGIANFKNNILPKCQVLVR